MVSSDDSFLPKKGTGWHPDDGPCSMCGAPQGEVCKPDCSEGAPLALLVQIKDIATEYVKAYDGDASKDTSLLFARHVAMNKLRKLLGLKQP